jgi:hypothetical protein
MQERDPSKPASHSLELGSMLINWQSEQGTIESAPDCQQRSEKGRLQKSDAAQPGSEAAPPTPSGRAAAELQSGFRATWE